MSRAVRVTGGGAGIAWAAGHRFATEGDRVMLADIDRAAAEARASALGPPRGAIGADIAAPNTAQTLVEACVARFGRHLEAQFLASQAGYVMLAQGFGALVNLATASGLAAGLGPEGGALAAASALGMLTRSIACEWGSGGVRANGLAVGPLNSEQARRLPTGRPISPEAGAGAVAFLLPSDAGYVSGAVVAIYGSAARYAGTDLGVTA